MCDTELPTVINSVCYSLMGESDFEKAFDLMMADFVKREPITVAMQVDWDNDPDLKNQIANYVRSSIASGLSIKAAANKELIGMRLTMIKSVDPDQKNFRAQLKENISDVSEKTQELITWLMYVDSAIPNLFEKYGIEKYAEFAAVSIASAHCNKGIAEQLYKLSFQLFKKEGLQLCKLITANPAIAHICEDKLGFEKIASVKVTDFEFKGKKVLSHFQPADAEGIVFIKEIS
jgi:hypothetical protein